MKEMGMCLYYYERDGDVSPWLRVVKTNGYAGVHYELSWDY